MTFHKKPPDLSEEEPTHHVQKEVQLQIDACDVFTLPAEALAPPYSACLLPEVQARATK